MLFAAGLSLSVSAQVANVKVTVTPLGDKFEGRHEVPFSSTTSDILVNENFEAMTKGTPEALISTLRWLRSTKTCLSIRS